MPWVGKLSSTLRLRGSDQGESRLSRVDMNTSKTPESRSDANTIVSPSLETLGCRSSMAVFRPGTGIPTEKFDVSDFDLVQSAIAKISENYGPVDILINNAGITRDGTMHRMSFENWDAVIQTNLASCFNTSKAVIESMRERNFGRIINVGSVNGQAGQYGQVNYAAAKSGIHGFTKALALENAAKGITVNAIAPGYVDTDMVRAVPEDVLVKIIKTIPVGRLGRPEDIANSVAFLVDDESSFITGSTLSINGGQHMY